MTYVDGYVIPLPTKNLKAYKRMATIGAEVWLDHGALEYRECAAEDMTTFCGIPFPKQMKLKKGETVVFAWIVFKSRKQRDQINAKVMKDKRLTESMKGKPIFDYNRMVYGGFDVLVEA